MSGYLLDSRADLPRMKYVEHDLPDNWDIEIKVLTRAIMAYILVLLTDVGEP